MIGAIVAAAAGVTAVPVAGGLVYRKSRQRRVAQVLVIDTPNRIVEERFVRVGEIDQWIQIRGEDRDNPVLLVLHGGPGWPNAVFTLPLRPWGATLHGGPVGPPWRGQDTRPKWQGRQRGNDVWSSGRRRSRAR